ncbi:response regulator transcription factor [Streptomyces mirabilis]|uniref:Response regulator transcription factor n=1 Tax=Streptomyces mirabilis TaxID=68239 RepID=A0ABU3V6B1_9ACTN|nr:response regulator transcription factor [Streptomyces mirabilis]MCX5355706.1 response regulator transcription factor [Streptomyces mirabilis]MDU9001349.1 response regulator transcription factor [Streptomyces mirabilis]
MQGYFAQAPESADISSGGRPLLASVPTMLAAPSVTREGSPETRALPIRLALTASDALTEEGAQSCLKAMEGVQVLPWRERQGAQIALVLAYEVTADTLRVVEEAAADSPLGRQLPVLLVADAVSERNLVHSVSLGVVGVLLRAEVRFADLVEAARNALLGQSPMPASMIRTILNRLRVLESGRSRVPELTPREVNVLQLVAEGLRTAEIAAHLNYSERTIKNILHEMITRLNLRNRTQAVAYAIRSGQLQSR